MDVANRLFAIVSALMSVSFGIMACAVSGASGDATPYIASAIAWLAFALAATWAGRFRNALRAPSEPADLSRLGDMTAEGLREQMSADDEQAYCEALWEACPDMERKMLAEIDHAVLEAARHGLPELRVSFCAYMAIERLLDIVDVDGSMSDVGRVKVELYNFVVPRRARRGSRWAFPTAASAVAFEDSARNRVAAHFKEKGLDAEITGLASPSVVVRWMGHGEYGSLKEAIAQPGGYEAYRAGVPVEDIVA